MKSIKPLKARTTGQSVKSKIGAGDFYGTGVRNKIGSIRDVSTPGANPVSRKGLKQAPKKLA